MRAITNRTRPANPNMATSTYSATRAPWPSLDVAIPMGTVRTRAWINVRPTTTRVSSWRWTRLYGDDVSWAVS